jgi:hypothetical protein
MSLSSYLIMRGNGFGVEATPSLVLSPTTGARVVRLCLRLNLPELQLQVRTPCNSE